MTNEDMKAITTLRLSKSALDAILAGLPEGLGGLAIAKEQNEANEIFDLLAKASAKMGKAVTAIRTRNPSVREHGNSQTRRAA